MGQFRQETKRLGKPGNGRHGLGSAYCDAMGNDLITADD